MNKVPNMISTKDLSYLCDMFNWNMIILNKLKCFSNDIIDENIKEKFTSLIDMHTSHANTIKEIIKEDNN